MAHDAAVVQHGRAGQPLLGASDAGRQVGQVAHQEPAGADLRGGGAHDALTKAALGQLVNGQGLGDGDVAGLQLIGAEAAAADRQGTYAGDDERCGLAVALLVVGQNLRGSEHIQIHVGGEIAAFEEGRLGSQLLDRRQHIQGVVNIHSDVLLYSAIMFVNTMSYFRRVSLSAAVSA